MQILYDISLAGGEWSIEASEAVVELTQYRTLQAQITSYTETGVPEIHLYSFLSPNVSRTTTLLLHLFANLLSIYCRKISILGENINHYHIRCEI